MQERPQAGDEQTADLSVARRGAANQPISQSANQPGAPMERPGDTGAPLRATEESGDVGRSPTEKAKPLSLQASKLPPKSPGGCRGFGEVRSAYQLMAAGMPS